MRRARKWWICWSRTSTSTASAIAAFTPPPRMAPAAPFPRPSPRVWDRERILHERSRAPSNICTAPWLRPIPWEKGMDTGRWIISICGGRTLNEPLDLLVVGAGPTGIAIGAEARRQGLSVLLVDRGPLTAAIQGYPTFMEFFTTRDRLEIANIPFTIPDDKPTRRQALAYYRFVVDHYKVPLALYEDVLEVKKEREEFTVHTRRERLGPRTLRARAVAIATGYFVNPRRLDVPGEDLPWVSFRYKEPFAHFGQDVVVIGAGNTAAEAALDLWRSGVRATLVHRG